MLKMFKKREEFGIQHRWFNPKLLLAFPVLVVVFLVFMHWVRRPGTDTQSVWCRLSVTALRYFYILSAVFFFPGLTRLCSPNNALRRIFPSPFRFLIGNAGP